MKTVEDLPVVVRIPDSGNRVTVLNPIGQDVGFDLAHLDCLQLSPLGFTWVSLFDGSKRRDVATYEDHQVLQARLIVAGWAPRR